MWQRAIAAWVLLAAVAAFPAAGQKAGTDSPEGLAQALLLQLVGEWRNVPLDEGRVICLEAEFRTDDRVDSLDVSAAIDSMRELHGRAAPGHECDMRRRVIRAAPPALQKPLLTYPEGPMLHTATGALAVKYRVLIRELPEGRSFAGGAFRGHLNAVWCSYTARYADGKWEFERAEVCAVS
jgi:hypothetical protein